LEIITKGVPGDASTRGAEGKQLRHQLSKPPEGQGKVALNTKKKSWWRVL